MNKIIYEKNDDEWLNDFLIQKSLMSDFYRETTRMKYLNLQSRYKHSICTADFTIEPEIGASNLSWLPTGH